MMEYEKEECFCNNYRFVKSRQIYWFFKNVTDPKYGQTY